MFTANHNFLYQKIYTELLRRIQEGEYQKGDKLPTEHELMKEYEASRDTVRKAMKMLEEDDYVLRISAKGTFVKYNQAQVNVTRMLGFTDMMRANNRQTTAKILEVSLLEHAEQEVLNALHLTSLHKIYRVSRLRYVDDELISLERAYVPYRLCPDLDTYIKPQNSLYRLYESVYQLHLGESEVALSATHPSEEVANLMGITTMTPVLCAKNTGYLSDGTPLYYALSFHEGSRYIYRSFMRR